MYMRCNHVKPLPYLVASCLIDALNGTSIISLLSFMFYFHLIRIIIEADLIRNSSFTYI